MSFPSPPPQGKTPPLPPPDKGWFHQLTGVPFAWSLNPSGYKQLTKQVEEQLKIREDIDKQVEETQGKLKRLYQVSTDLSNEQKQAEIKKLELEKRSKELSDKYFKPSATQPVKVAINTAISKIPIIGPLYTAYGYYSAAKDMKELKETKDQITRQQQKIETIQEDKLRHDDFANIDSDKLNDLRKRLAANERALANVQNALKNGNGGGPSSCNIS